MIKPRVAINGFGRIGRTLLRELLIRDTCEVVAINELADAATMLHLFRYDSVHGKWEGNSSCSDDELILNGHRIQWLRTANPAELPWSSLRIDIVVECTGQFRNRTAATMHLNAGANHVLLSAPPENDASVPMVIAGLNDDEKILHQDVLSCASCTTNSAAPLIQLLDELCGIESCYVTTVHSYTGDQRLHDAPHKDLRRGRAAAESIVPTSTGAAKALSDVFPHLGDRIGGCGIRVPVPDGSLTDLTAMVRNPGTADEINAWFEAAARGAWRGILEVADAPIVSRDVIGNPHSCIFDAPLTSVIGNMVKVVGWYDNEVGYSNRLADIIPRIVKG
jgi:glyceraldehyde 3-phosphate dehydrogenase